MGRPALNKLLQYTWQRANLERNYNENAQNINYASILINPEIPGLAEPQSRDFGIGKKAGIPGFQLYPGATRDRRSTVGKPLPNR